MDAVQPAVVAKELERMERDLRRLQAMGGLDPMTRALARRMATLVKLFKAMLKEAGKKHG